MIKSPHGIYSTETQHVFIIFQRLIVISSRLLKCILQKEHRGQDKFRRQEKVLSAEKCGVRNEKVVIRGLCFGDMEVRNAECLLRQAPAWRADCGIKKVTRAGGSGFVTSNSQKTK